MRRSCYPGCYQSLLCLIHPGAGWVVWAHCFKSGWEWICGYRWAQSGEDRIFFLLMKSHQDGEWQRCAGVWLLQPLLEAELQPHSRYSCNLPLVKPPFGSGIRSHPSPGSRELTGCNVSFPQTGDMRLRRHPEQDLLYLSGLWVTFSLTMVGIVPCACSYLTHLPDT